jgi:hypothetical protein
MSSSNAGSSETDAPRYALAWAALVYVLLTLALGYPALGGGFLITPPSDQYIGGFPVRDFAAQSLKNGLGIPLWNPYIFGGMPYVAAMGVGDIYYPTQLLRALLPVDIGMTLGFMLHVFMAGLFMYVFLRAVGLSFMASLIGGAAYMLGGPTAGLVSPGHDGKLFVGALTPLALWMLLQWVRRGLLWALGGFALTVGLAVLTPHPQPLQYSLLLAGAFGLYCAFGWNGEPLARKLGIQRLALAFVAVVIGFAIGAIQYAPFIEYIPFSPRADGIAGGYDAATSFSMPIEELLNAYLPEFSGLLSKYWGQNGIHHHSDYFGVFVLMLATAAIGAKGKAIGLSRSFKWFVLGVLVVSTLWALGGFTPFYRIVYAIVPGTKFFRAPSTIMYLMAFAVSIFAAIGVERILTDGVKRNWAIGWGIGAVVVMLLAVSGGFTNLGSTIITSATEQRYQMLGATPAQIASGVQAAVDEVVANASEVSYGSVRSLFFALMGIALCFGITQGRLSARAGGLALLAAVSVDLWVTERKYWGFSPRATEVYRSDATIDYLKAHRDSGRVMTLVLSSNMAYHDVMLTGDGLMVHQIRQAIGYHGNSIGRYDNLVSADSILSNAGMRSLLNVRYLLANELLPDSTLRSAFGPTARLVAGPARNAPGTMVYLYDMGPSDAAWVATTAVKAPDESALPTLRDRRFNAATQRSVAILDTASTTPALPSLTEMPKPSTLTARVQRPTHSRISVELSAPAQDGNVLIVSENFYPGWKAVVDGKPASAERVDYTLIGVPLTAGARKVELEFTSSTSAMGKIITIVAVLLSLALIGVGLLPNRRGGAVATGAA